MTNNNNPWAGLASYEDPSKSERKLKFCGRDNDIYDVTRLIDDNLLLILYGKSGIGKTSLLNAGVFPKLRIEQYLPVSIRLGTLEAHASYQEAIISAVEKAIEEVHGSKAVFNVVEDQTDNQQPDRLWNYFAKHRFYNAEQQPLFPVVVLDQFEEVLRNTSPEHVGKAQTLLNQLQYLIDESHALSDCIVDGQEYFYDFNYRFVISIREDELYLLEDNIDDLSLSLFRNCRYRLRPMKPEQARQVVLGPGENCIKTADKETITNRIVTLAKQDNQNSIDTILLSLICSELYNIANQNVITKELIDQLGDNILSSFYEKAMHSVSPITSDYLESHLLTQSGFRNSMALEDVLHERIKREDIDKLIEQKLLRIEQFDGIERVEFTHDALCSMAKSKRDKQIEVSKRKSERSHNVGFFFDIALPLSGLLSVIIPVWQTQGASINIVYVLVLLFGCCVFFPYRHTKERNSVWFSLIQCFLFSGLIYVVTPFDEVVAKGVDSEFMLSLVLNYLLIGIGGSWYWIQTIISVGFKKKCSLIEAVKYAVKLQVYKDHPKFKIILLIVLIVSLCATLIMK